MSDDQKQDKRMEKDRIFDKMKSIVGDGPDKKSYLGDDDFVEVRHRGVKISFHVKNRQIDLARLLGTVHRIVEKIKTHLDIDLDGIEIEIYENRRQWAERHTVIGEKEIPSWVQGDAGRVVRIIMDPDGPGSFKKLQLMVTHECVHLAVDRFCKGNAPAWLDEGLATYISQNLPPAYEATLKEAVEKKHLLPLDLLSKSFARFQRQDKYLAYAQSHSLVSHIVENHGWELIRELLNASALGDSIETCLRTRGLNLYILEKEWERRLRSVAMS